MQALKGRAISHVRFALAGLNERPMPTQGSTSGRESGQTASPWANLEPAFQAGPRLFPRPEAPLRMSLTNAPIQGGFPLTLSWIRRQSAVESMLPEGSGRNS